MARQRKEPARRQCCSEMPKRGHRPTSHLAGSLGDSSDLGGGKFPSPGIPGDPHADMIHTQFGGVEAERHIEVLPSAIGVPAVNLAAAHAGPAGVGARKEGALLVLSQESPADLPAPLF